MIEDADLSCPKIFVTGIYGSGKTTAALRISHATGRTYKSFDANWSYKRRGRAHASQHLIGLGHEFVTDAIAFSNPPDPYFSFTQFYNEHLEDVLILCVTCLNIAKWKERLRSKQSTPPVERLTGNFIDFHKITLPSHNGKNILYYDTAAGSYVSQENIHSYIKSLS